MTKNYVGGCTYDLLTVTCALPKGYANIKGALLYASFVSGAGYLPEARDLADRNLFLGGMTADNYVAFYPNSAVLAHMDRWPAVFCQGFMGSCRERGGHPCCIRPGARPEADRRGARSALDGDMAAVGEQPGPRPHGELCRRDDPEPQQCARRSDMDERQGTGGDDARCVGDVLAPSISARRTNGAHNGHGDSVEATQVDASSASRIWRGFKLSGELDFR